MYTQFLINTAKGWARWVEHLPTAANRVGLQPTVISVCLFPSFLCNSHYTNAFQQKIKAMPWQNKIFQNRLLSVQSVAVFQGQYINRNSNFYFRGERNVHQSKVHYRCHCLNTNKSSAWDIRFRNWGHTNQNICLDCDLSAIVIWDIQVSPVKPDSSWLYYCCCSSLKMKEPSTQLWGLGARSSRCELITSGVKLWIVSSWL